MESASYVHNPVCLIHSVLWGKDTFGFLYMNSNVSFVCKCTISLGCGNAPNFDVLEFHFGCSY